MSRPRGREAEVRAGATRLFLTTVAAALLLLAAATPARAITTVAGGFGDGGQAATASLSLSTSGSTARAPDGSLYIADTYHSRIRKVAPDGTITTVAGNGTAGFTGDGGPATSAQFFYAVAVAVAADGTLFIADLGNQRIRRVTPGGVISTVAGNGTYGFSGDGGPATSARLATPVGVDVGEDGSLYIVDQDNQRIRRVTPSGTITTVAGTGANGFSGDGGPATSAALSNPYGVTATADGTLFITDTSNNRVRRVTPSGTITTVAGAGANGFSGDGGPATSAALSNPYGVTATADGTLFIADTGNHRIRRVDPTGVISTVAGSGPFHPAPGSFGGDGGPAVSTTLNSPSAVSTAPDGTLYINDQGNNRIRRVTPGGTIGTLAGNGFANYGGDGGTATSASLYTPRGVAVAADGSLYIADTNNHRVRRVSPSGAISTLAGSGTPGFSGDNGQANSAQLNAPSAVAVAPDGTLYIADTNNNRVRTVTPAGVISTLAGTGIPAFSGDGGPPASASLQAPYGVALGADGALFIADTGNHRIRKVPRGGTIATAAGSASGGFGGDEGPATSARLNAPRGVELAADGTLFIADTGNNRVRKVTVLGTITTLAGDGTAGFAGEAGPAVVAQLSSPRSVAALGGAIYVADTTNQRIRKVASNGTISTVAGDGTPGFAGDGGPATLAQLYNPSGVAVAANGTFYVADTSNQRIRMQTQSAPMPTTLGASAVSATSATLNATVVPGDSDTTYNFEWGLSASSASSTAEGQLSAGTDPRTVTADITGLTPGTTYHVRIVAANSHGTSHGADVAFTTGAAPSPGCANPRISAVEPATPTAGEPVVVTGTGFGGSGTLRFGSTPAASVETWTPTLIAARVAAASAGATTVSVTCPDGVMSPAVSLTVLPAANQRPVAVISDLSASGRRHTLDSSASYDADGDIARRAWTISGRTISTKAWVSVLVQPGQRRKVTLTVWVSGNAGDSTSVALSAARRRGTTVVLNARVLFGVDRAALTPAGRRVIRRLRAIAATSSRITISGFASHPGPTGYNRHLSLERALSVKHTLLHGLRTRAQVRVVANGERGHPRVKETGPRTRQMNRKVMVRLISAR